MKAKLESIIKNYKNDPNRLMDILLDVQTEFGYISSEAIQIIAQQTGLSKVDVEQTISFYHFFSFKPVGKYAVYLNDNVVANMMGRKEIAKAFEQEVGCKFGKVTADGVIGLHNTSCIGMNDQEPSAIINGYVFTKLTSDKVKELVAAFKAGKKVDDMITTFGDGANNSSTLKAMVNNNIQKKGAVIFSEYETGASLKKVGAMNPDDVINEVKASNIRGRGGAGFPTGMKWEFCKRAKGEHYILCNADEGEPGTFKDRVILTEKSALLFEGMTIAGYAIGASQGILYLRNEYKYLKSHLENTLEELKKKNLLGEKISGKDGFNFNIRIQFGAGAYVCGEESALIESCEGKRGEPRNRPPFPVQKGYLNQPTVINNVETLCSVVRILEKGSSWYKSLGTQGSSGTKLLSISGDCKNPGIYEIEWGMTIKDMLTMAGAEKTMAVQVAGPSGRCIAPNEFNKKIAYEELATGGAMIIIGQNRNLLKDVVLNFTNFFIEESCGSCTPCRSLTPILKEKLEKILNGNGREEDINDLERLGKMMKTLNRCGLGQTAANPILTTIENFREKYESLIKATEDEKIYAFDMAASVQESCAAVNRKPLLN